MAKPNNMGQENRKINKLTHMKALRATNAIISVLVITENVKNITEWYLYDGPHLIRQVKLNFP